MEGDELVFLKDHFGCNEKDTLKQDKREESNRRLFQKFMQKIIVDWTRKVTMIKEINRGNQDIYLM